MVLFKEEQDSQDTQSAGMEIGKTVSLFSTAAAIFQWNLTLILSFLFFCPLAICVYYLNELGGWGKRDSVHL